MQNISAVLLENIDLLLLQLLVTKLKAVADGPVGQVLTRPVSECNKNIFTTFSCEQLKIKYDMSMC